MKQNLKYGLLVVLLLLYSVRISAVNVAELPTESVQEECFLSQARSAGHVFERFFIYYFDMPCELSHADVSHFPTDKSIVRHFTRFREHRAMNNTFPNGLLHSTIYSLSHPVSYYVFGLRKIII